MEEEEEIKEDLQTEEEEGEKGEGGGEIALYDIRNMKKYKKKCGSDVSFLAGPLGLSKAE